MSQFFEALMVISFGISWPISIAKSIKSKTSKGKSIIFMIFILFGYVFGIISKLVSGKITYVLVFYVINLIMVAIDTCLYVRNVRLDQNTQQNLQKQQVAETR